MRRPPVVTCLSVLGSLIPAALLGVGRAHIRAQLSLLRTREARLGRATRQVPPLAAVVLKTTP